MKKELLIISGILSIAGGAVLMLCLAIGRSRIDAGGWVILTSLAALGFIGGFGLARLRKWGGVVIAVTSIGLSILHYGSLIVGCHGCEWFVWVLNGMITAMILAPGVAVISWRRFLS